MPKKKKAGALVAGSNAFANGLELKDNPYDPSEKAHLLWNQGWKFASEKRKDYDRHEEEQETIDPRKGFDWISQKLTPEKRQPHSSSILAWPAISGIVIFIGVALGFKAVIALITFFIFTYSCAAVFALVRHFAGQYGNQPWQKVLSYATGSIIGLVIILILWQMMTFVFDRLGISLW